MKRAQFLKTLAFGGGALLAKPLFAFQPQPKGTFFDLQGGAGYFTLRGGTIGWYKDRDVFLMIDSQFADAAPVFADQFLGDSGRKIDLLINTHHHGDHTGGNKAIRDRVVKIVGQAQIPVYQKKQAEQRNALDQIAMADETFDTSKKIKLGNETIQLKHFGAAHSAGDTVILLEKANVAHMGDLMFNRMPAVIDRSSGASVENWISVLEKSNKWFDKKTKIIFGHGNPKSGVAGNKTDLLIMRDFFNAAMENVRKAIKNGKSRDEIVLTEKLEGFEDFYREDRKDAVGRMLGLVWDEQTGVAVKG